MPRFFLSLALLILGSQNAFAYGCLHTRLMSVTCKLEATQPLSDDQFYIASEQLRGEVGWSDEERASALDDLRRSLNKGSIHFAQLRLDAPPGRPDRCSSAGEVFLETDINFQTYGPLDFSPDQEVGQIDLGNGLNTFEQSDMEFSPGTSRFVLKRLHLGNEEVLERPLEVSTTQPTVRKFNLLIPAQRRVPAQAAKIEVLAACQPDAI